MFITVRFGDGHQVLFNPKCRINTLLENIKLKCNCDKKVIIDLCDEKGSMKKLFENTDSYANEFLNERDSFILIKVERKDEEDCYKFTPLLNDLFVSATFLDALSQAEKDTGSGSVKTSLKANSRQSKKKPSPAKAGKSTPQNPASSPRLDKEKTATTTKITKPTPSKRQSKVTRD